MMHTAVDPEVYWPDIDAPFRRQLDRSDVVFEKIRESALLDYGYNTARAYAADLDALHDFQRSRGCRLEAMTNSEFERYAVALLADGYRASTLRRRRTALNRYLLAAGQTQLIPTLRRARP